MDRRPGWIPSATQQSNSRCRVLKGVHDSTTARGPPTTKIHDCYTIRQTGGRAGRSVTPKRRHTDDGRRNRTPNAAVRMHVFRHCSAGWPGWRRSTAAGGASSQQRPRRRRTRSRPRPARTSGRLQPRLGASSVIYGPILARTCFEELRRLSSRFADSHAYRYGN